MSPDTMTFSTAAINSVTAIFTTKPMDWLVRRNQDDPFSVKYQCFDAVGWAAGRASGL